VNACSLSPIDLLMDGPLIELLRGQPFSKGLVPSDWPLHLLFVASE
jgi:hypothetical protein